jgi:hypothetical protein
MPELKVLDNGHPKLDYAEWKEFFTQDRDEWVRSQVKRLIEQALEVERHSPPAPPLSLATPPAKINPSFF